MASARGRLTIAPWLIAGFLVSDTAFCQVSDTDFPLRPMADRSGLEETLRPAAGLEENLHRDSGLEEKKFKQYSFKRYLQRLEEFLRALQGRKSEGNDRRAAELAQRLSREVEERFGEAIKDKKYESFIAAFLRSDDPTKLQQQARPIFQSIAGPSARIFFIPPDDVLLWTLCGGYDPKTAGTHGVVSDELGEAHRLILIRNDLDDFETLSVLAHETAHAQQSIRVFQKAGGDPFLRCVIEGFQRFREHEILLSIGKQNSSFGKQVRKATSREYSEAIAFIENVGIGYGDQDPNEFQRQLSFLQSSSLLAGSDSVERIFVDRLIGRIGKKAIETFYKKGNVKKLRDRLGPHRFDALRLFFGEWEKFKAERRGEIPALAALIISKVIVEAEVFPQSFIPRMIGVTDVLFRAAERQKPLNQAVAIYPDKVEPLAKEIAIDVLACLKGNLDKRMLAIHIAIAEGKFHRSILDLNRTEGSAGLEEGAMTLTVIQESWHGIRSQAPRGITAVVISRVAQEMHPPLKVLGGLEEEKVILSQGDYRPDVVKLIGQDARSAIFVGLEEEAERFIPLAKQAGIETRVISPRTTDFPKLILTILSQATGLEEAFLESQRSFQQFAAGLESLATGA